MEETQESELKVFLVRKDGHNWFVLAVDWSEAIAKWRNSLDRSSEEQPQSIELLAEGCDLIM